MLNRMCLRLLLPMPLLATAMLPLIPSYSLDPPKYDPLLQEFVWFEDDSTVEYTEDQETYNVRPQSLLSRKLINTIREVPKTILRLKKRESKVESPASIN